MHAEGLHQWEPETMMEPAQQIAENVARVRARVREAARAHGRDETEITMVAVTKYVGGAEVQLLLQAGCRDLGENRPQQLWSKTKSLGTPALDQPVRWHLVGHLQRNKVNRTLPLVSLIHSVDSVRLIESIERHSASRPEPTPILLEVNVAAEAAKHGFAPQQLDSLLPTMTQYPHVRLLGLMTMASLAGGRDQARRDFEKLRRLRDRLRATCPPDVSLNELSMGMSRDFDLAIAEGATIVRIGSALFEGIIR